MTTVPVIKQEAVTSLVDGVIANLDVLLPAGVTIFGVIVAISLIPKIFNTFIKS